MPGTGFHSKECLARARTLLDQTQPESLFYAALELRFGVEARMKEYLAAQQHISEAKKEGWRIAKLAKNLESAFRLGDKVVEFTVLDKGTKEPLHTLYYTPVTSGLQKMAKRLGNYLHANSPAQAQNDQWCGDFRNFLESVWAELRKATTGTLLGPPLMHRETRQIRMTIEFDSNDERARYYEQANTYGAEAIVRIDYHDDLPVSAHH